ncbi:hypothetical protein [Treponema sp.]|uniref:hypothetical protein n=1 Tax=Treponema sp. TaxID=166 RepID=UPI00298E4DE1|nr:hypothetical protein [Treponema sp.]
MKFESKKLVTKLVLALFMMAFCSTVAFAEQASDDLSGHAYCATIYEDGETATAGFYFKEDGRVFVITDRLYSIGEVLKVLSKKNVSENEISQLGASIEDSGKWSQNKAKNELTVILSDGEQIVLSYIISSDGKILRFDEERLVLDRYY